jgi:hypothetical protein
MITTRLAVLACATLAMLTAAPAAHATARIPQHRLELPHSRTVTPAAAPGPRDVTGDGRADLVARDGGGTLWVYPNGGGADPWTTRYPAGLGWNLANVLLLADVTGDGRPDMIARDPAVDAGTLWIYPHNGSATANPWIGRTWAGTGWNLATAMTVGDLTGDGRPEMVIRDATGALWAYPHNGSTSGNPYTLKRFWVGSGWNTASAIVLGDIDGDGLQDLVDREKDGSMWIYLTGSAGAPIRVDGNWKATDMSLLGDLSGTGRLDLVSRTTTGTLTVSAHNGSTTTNPWPAAQPAGNWSFATMLVL